MRQQLACLAHFCYTWAESYERGIDIPKKRYHNFTSEYAMRREVASHG